MRVHYLEVARGLALPLVGRREPIVLLHGNWATCSWWKPTLARLPAGVHAYACDLRGRGKTEGPDTDYSIPSLAADVDAFTSTLGLGRFHLVGHSLGSAIAMQYAFDHADRVRSLALVAPAWVDGMPRALDVPGAQRALKSNLGMFARALRAVAPTAPEDDSWRRLVEESHGQRLEAALRNLPALVDWQPREALRDLRVPCLVVVGSRDTLTGGGNAARVTELLGGRLVVLEGVGHSPPLEAPARLAELLWEHARVASRATARGRPG